MRFLHKLTPFLSVVAALELVWRLEKDSGKTSLSAYSSSNGSLVAETCGSTLEAGNKIDFSHVSEDGVGNFTVGDQSYRCSGVEWAAEDIIPGDAMHCWEKDYSQRALQHRQSREMHSRSFDKREPYLLVWPTRETVLVGDGDPHQNYLHKQLSETISCGNANSCTVGHMESESYTIGFSADVSPADWISGGFSVSKSWTTGNSYTCTAGPGETVCIWYNTAHTAYTVQKIDPYFGDRVYVLYSPNQKNRGGGYYCVIGTCRSQGDQYWDKSGRAGGP